MNYAEPGSTTPIVLSGGVDTDFPAGGVGTFGVRLEDMANNVVVARSTALIEIGAGVYRAFITWPGVEGDYIPIWDNGAGVDLADDITHVGEPAPVVAGSLSLSDIREHVETGLVDDALARLLVDATEEVEARFGTDANVTEILAPGGSTIILKRRASAIVSVDLLDSSGASYQTLGASEYRLRSGRILDRMSGGTTGYDWVREYDAPGYGSTEVKVVYTPVSEAALRNRVIIDLVRLGVKYEALANEKIGDYSMTSADYLKERERLLQAVSNRRGLRIA